MEWVQAHKKLIGTTAGLVGGAVISAAAVWGFDADPIVTPIVMAICALLGVERAPANVPREG